MGRISIAVFCLLAMGTEFKVTIVKPETQFRVTVVRSPALAESAKPVLEVIGDTWCAPCNAAKDVLSAAKDLPFTVKHVSASATGYDKDIPAFRWKSPSGKTYTLTGWYGIDHLLSEFKRYK